METDWSKVLEVFGSGIIGVFLVMFLLQILTQLSTRVIDFVENMNKDKTLVPVPQEAATKEKV
jgi:hypothetical protein